MGGLPSVPFFSSVVGGCYVRDEFRSFLQNGSPIELYYALAVEVVLHIRLGLNLKKKMDEEGRVVKKIIGEMCGL